VGPGRGLCNEPIPRPEESYRLCCVIVCDLDSSRMRWPWPELDCCGARGGGLGIIYGVAFLKNNSHMNRPQSVAYLNSEIGTVTKHTDTDF
jgi:hypothetical protein